MDPPFMAFANICIFGVMFMLFASIVDSTEQWQQPVIAQPNQPNPQQNVFPPPPPQQNLIPPPQNTNMPPAAPPPSSSSKAAPPPKSSRSKPKNSPSQAPAPAPSLHASPPSTTPPNKRPFVSAPSPIQGEQNRPPLQRMDNDVRKDLGKKIGLLFLGVILIMQVIVVIFLIIKRRQLFNPDY